MPDGANLQELAQHTEGRSQLMIVLLIRRIVWNSLLVQVAWEVKHILDICWLKLLFQGASKHAGVACCGCIVCSQNALYL